MFKLFVNLIIFFLVSSCITVNYNPQIPQKTKEKSLQDKQSTNNNFNKSKPNNLSEERRKKLVEFTKIAGKSFGNCLEKLKFSGLITRSQSKKFIYKVTRGLKVENMLLFATATKNDDFCIKWVPYYIDKDSYELDDAINRYWEKRKKRR